MRTTRHLIEDKYRDNHRAHTVKMIKEAMYEDVSRFMQDGKSEEEARVDLFWWIALRAFDKGLAEGIRLSDKTNMDEVGALLFTIGKLSELRDSLKEEDAS